MDVPLYCGEEEVETMGEKENVGRRKERKDKIISKKEKTGYINIE